MENKELFKNYFKRWIDLSTLFYRSRSQNWIKTGIQDKKFLRETASALEISLDDYNSLVLKMFERCTAYDMEKQDDTGQNIKIPRNQDQFLNLLEPTEVVRDEYNIVCLHVQVLDLKVSPKNEVIPTLATISYKTKNVSGFHAIDLQRPEGSIKVADAIRQGYSFKSDGCRAESAKPHYCWKNGKCEEELQVLTNLITILQDSSRPNIIIFPQNDRSIGVLLYALSKYLLLEDFRRVVRGVGSMENMATLSGIELKENNLSGFEKYYRDSVLHPLSRDKCLFSEQSACMLWEILEKFLNGPPTYDNLISKHCSGLHSSFVDLRLRDCGLLELRSNYHELILTRDLTLPQGATAQARILIGDPVPTIDKAYNLFCYGPLFSSSCRVIADKDCFVKVSLTNSGKRIIKLRKEDQIGVASKMNQFPLPIRVKTSTGRDYMLDESFEEPISTNQSSLPFKMISEPR